MCRGFVVLSDNNSVFKGKKGHRRSPNLEVLLCLTRLYADAMELYCAAAIAEGPVSPPLNNFNPNIVITSITHCGMTLHLHSQTSTAPPLIHFSGGIRGLVYKRGLTLIQGWISNHVPSKV